MSGFGRVTSVALLRAMRAEILPLVTSELGHWQAVAAALPAGWTRTVALDSLAAKRFHCEGGAVLALCAPREAWPRLVRAIVAVQTLSDFLDSFTGRSASGETLSAGRVVAWHRPFVRAVAALPVDPDGPWSAGLRGSAHAYAQSLACEARMALTALPGIERARPRLLALAFAYASMQAMKHGERPAREGRLDAWHARRAGLDRAVATLTWPEFGAACGSTLAMFRLYAWAAAPEAGGRPQAVAAAYSPHVGALHILLDSVIDAAEDAESGDLNWLHASVGESMAPSRLVRMMAAARERLRGDALERLLVPGLVATYLCDPKARRLALATRLMLWRAAGPRAWLFASALGSWRRRGLVGARPAQLAADARPAAEGRPATEGRPV